MDYHDILRETGIVLIWAPELHDKGLYVPYAEECGSDNGIIFVDSTSVKMKQNVPYCMNVVIK